MNYEEFLKEVRSYVEGDEDEQNDKDRWRDGKLEDCLFEIQDGDSDNRGDSKMTWFTVVIEWDSGALKEENMKKALFKKKLAQAEESIRKEVYGDE